MVMGLSRAGWANSLLDCRVFSLFDIQSSPPDLGPGHAGQSRLDPIRRALERAGSPERAEAFIVSKQP